MNQFVNRDQWFVIHAITLDKFRATIRVLRRAHSTGKRIKCVFKGAMAAKYYGGGIT